MSLQGSKSTKKLSRAEKNVQTRARLISAAAKVIGAWGYAGASVVRITTEAGVGQGTFYYHFLERTEIFNLVLPSLADQMFDYLRSHDNPSLCPVERDVFRLKMFFDFLVSKPEFVRVYEEAEFFAFEAFARHSKVVHDLYFSTIRKERSTDTEISDVELSYLVDFLLGIRRSLIPRVITKNGEIIPLSDDAVSSYRKFLENGLREFGLISNDLAE